jgi:hypothetical protein
MLWKVVKQKVYDIVRMILTVSASMRARSKMVLQNSIWRGESSLGKISLAKECMAMSRAVEGEPKREEHNNSSVFYSSSTLSLIRTGLEQVFDNSNISSPHLTLSIIQRINDGFIQGRYQERDVFCVM